MITEDISQQDLDAIEKYADKLFAKVGIDVEFTRHFLDRANDERNKKPITAPELIRIFRQEYKRWAKPIAQLGPDAEAVMKDMATDINVPFVLKWDRENGELDLVAKTVMRKPNFKTPDREFPVEGSTGTTHSWNQLQTGLKSTFGHNTPVKTKTSGQVQKPKIKTAFNKVKDTVSGWFGEDDTKTDYAKLDIKQAEPIRAKFTPDWEIRKGKMLYKRVAFDDYNQALEFLEKLKEPQTELDHFADVQIFYNELEIVIYTHDVDGLTQLDFELALYVDDLVRKMSARIVDESACKYGRYYCSTDKKFKCRQGPKQSRTNENFADGKEKVQPTNEAFDNPYPITWEYLKPTGASSAIGKVEDGSALDIHISEDPDGIYEIEFARGQSNKNMGRSGQGDEFRIFATVQNAMLEWWEQLDKTKARKITFYANKEDGNRSRLYKRFLKMWGDKSEWDIEVNSNVKPGLVAYTLTNPISDEPKNDKKTFMQRIFGETETVENFADGKVKGKSRPGRVKRAGASCKGSVTDLRRKAKNSSGEKAKMYHWCANMKSGRQKESTMTQSNFAQNMYEQMQVQEKSRCKRTRAESCQCESIERINEAQQPVMAMCELTKDHGVEGLLLMAGAPGAPTVIVGEIHGLEPGPHGLHIHEYGNLTDGCASAGAHYNPDGVDHGNINEGHVGDLGNITADDDGIARIEIVAPRVELIGERSVVGRSFVVHKGEDDLGKGGDEESLKTGNAGDRLGCGVIVMTENTMNEGKLDEVLPALAVGAAARAILPRALPYLARGAKAAWKGIKRVGGQIVKPKNQKVDKKPKNNKQNNKADKKNLRRRTYGLGMGGGAGAGAGANAMSGDTDDTWTYSRPGQGIGETASVAVTGFFKKCATNDDEAFDMLYDAHGGKYGPEIERAVADMYNEISVDHGLHPDDDFEDIYERMVDEIVDDYGIKEDRAHQGDQSSFMQFGKIKPGTVKTGADGRKYKWLGAQWQDVASGRMASIDQRQQNNLRNKKVTVTKKQAKDTAKAVGKGALATGAAVAGLARGAMSNIGKIGDKGSDYNLKVRAAEAAGVGKIVKGVNTTPDVGVDAVKKQAAKFGFDVDKDGTPKHKLR